LKTQEFAQLMGITAESVRAALYRRGHYYGVRPHRLPNGRLNWPDAEVRRLLQGKGGEPSKAA